MAELPVTIDTVEVTHPLPGSYSALVRCRGGPAIEGDGCGRIACSKCGSPLAVGINDPDCLLDEVIFRCECGTYAQVVTRRKREA